MLCKNDGDFITNSSMTDKWLATAEGYYEAGGSVQHAFWEGISEFFSFWFRAES